MLWLCLKHERVFKQEAEDLHIKIVRLHVRTDLSSMQCYASTLMWAVRDFWICIADSLLNQNIVFINMVSFRVIGCKNEWTKNLIKK